MNIEFKKKILLCQILMMIATTYLKYKDVYRPHYHELLLQTMPHKMFQIYAKSNFMRCMHADDSYISALIGFECALKQLLYHDV